MQRDLTIDKAKAITIVLMLIGHCNGINNYLFKLIFSFHMPLFFILSGFLFKEKDSVTLIKNDFKKLVVPYIITILLSTLVLIPNASSDVLLNKLLGGFWGCIGSYRMIVDSPSLTSHAGPAWFLLSMFWCRSYFNFIWKLNKNYYMRISFFLFIVFWLLGMFLVNLPLCIGSGFTGLLFYAMGVKLKTYGLCNFKGSHYILFVVIWLFAAYYGYVNMSQYSYSTGPGLFHIMSFPLGILGALFGTLVVCKFSTYVKGERVEKCLAFIGTHTLEILCCHSVAFSLRYVLSNANLIDCSTVLQKDLALVILTIILSVLCILIKTTKK